MPQREHDAAEQNFDEPGSPFGGEKTPPVSGWDEWDKEGTGEKEEKTNRRPLASVVVLLVVAIAAVWWWRDNRFSSFEKDWQAVFLSNGQVYFGKVTKQNRKELVLSDIYYLQVVRQLQQQGAAQKDDKREPASTNGETGGELSLVKLGNEMHGPADTMYINRDQVLFIEDLKDDGQVARAIKNYKAKQ